MRHRLLWLLLSASTPALAAPAPPPAAPIPIEHFTRHDEIGDIKISPDGAHVALMVGKYGRSAIIFVRRADQKQVGGVRAPDRLEFDSFEWVSPTRIIYMVAQRQPGKATPSLTGEIAAIDIDGSRNVQVYGYRTGSDDVGVRAGRREASYASASVVSTLPGDPRRILIAEQPWRVVGGYWRYDPDARPRITLLDVYDGSKKDLGTAPLARALLLVDRDERPRFAAGWNAAGKYSVAWRPDLAAPWQEFELPGFVKDSVLPLHFSADNSAAYFVGVEDGRSHAALYRVILATGEVQTVAAVPGADVRAIVTDLRGEDVIGYATNTDRWRTSYLPPTDSPSARFYKALDRAFAGRTTHVTSTTEDGRLALVRVSSDTNPGDYYLIDTQAMKAELIRSSRSWIDPQTMRPREPISLKARDGLELHGYLTRPAGTGPHPLVVLPHGGPHGVRDRWLFDWESQLLASRGYAVLQVNFRGSDGYGLAFEQAGYREWGGKMQDDLTDATHWAIEQKVTTADRICIFGGSYGGYAALMGAAREPGLYRCAIGYAGVYDLELMHSSGDIPDSRSGRAYLELVLGDDVTQLRSRSPVHLAAAIQAPVLLIHGTADWRVDLEHAKRMKKALEQHGKPFEYLALAGEGHGAYDEDTRKQVYERVLAFLDRHLKSAPVAQN